MEEVDQYYRALCSTETLRSGTKGFFRDFTDAVVNKAGDTWIAGTFGKLDNDDERIRAILTHPRVKDTVVGTLNRVRHICRDKDPRISRNRRLEGIQFAATGEYNRALVLLSEAVLRSPASGAIVAIDNGYTLPLALLARADVLMALGEYELALGDLKATTDDNLSTCIRAIYGDRQVGDVSGDNVMHIEMHNTSGMW